MKLLFDQNISFRILTLLDERSQNCSSVKSESLTNNLDLEIWNFARKNGFAIVSQDSDFNDLSLLKGFPPKVIWIRTGNLSTKKIAELLSNHHSEIQSFLLDDELGIFEILSLN